MVVLLLLLLQVVMVVVVLLLLLLLVVLVVLVLVVLLLLLLLVVVVVQVVVNTEVGVIICSPANPHHFALPMRFSHCIFRINSDASMSQPSSRTAALKSTGLSPIAASALLFACTFASQKKVWSTSPVPPQYTPVTSPTFKPLTKSSRCLLVISRSSRASVSSFSFMEYSTHPVFSQRVRTSPAFFGSCLRLRVVARWGHSL
jgi:hypothetical protein